MIQSPGATEQFLSRGARLNKKIKILPIFKFLFHESLILGGGPGPPGPPVPRPLHIDHQRNETYSSSPEYCAVILHSFLHGQSQLCSRCWSISESQFVKVGHGCLSSIGAQLANFVTRFVLLGDGFGTCTSKDNQIQKRICTQSIGSVNRSASSFSTSVQSGNNFVLIIFVCDNLKYRGKKIFRLIFT